MPRNDNNESNNFAQMLTGQTGRGGRNDVVCAERVWNKIAANCLKSLFNEFIKVAGFSTTEQTITTTTIQRTQAEAGERSGAKNACQLKRREKVVQRANNRPTGFNCIFNAMENIETFSHRGKKNLLKERHNKARAANKESTSVNVNDQNDEL